MPRTPSSLLLPLLLLLLLPALISAHRHHHLHVHNNGDSRDADNAVTAVCPLPQGGTLKEGGTKVVKEHAENCTIQRCLSSGEIHEIIAKCFALPCVDPKEKTGGCCKYCTEINCRLPNGEILRGRSNSTRLDNKICRCPRGLEFESGGRPKWGVNLHDAVCDVITTPAPTTTTPVPQCSLPKEGKRKEGEKEDSSSELLAPGKERIVPKGDNCRKYVCDARGQLTTYHGQCPALTCSNETATRKEGGCCKICPGDLDNSTYAANYTRAHSPAHKKRFFFNLFHFLTHLLFGHRPAFGGHPTHHHHKKTTGSDVKTQHGGKGTGTSVTTPKKDGEKTEETKPKASGTAASSGKQKRGYFMIFHFGGGGGGFHMRRHRSHRRGHHGGRRGYGGHRFHG